MKFWPILLVLCACSSTSIEPSSKDAAEPDDSHPSVDVDASVVDDGPSDSKASLPEAFMGIPDALVYDPTYTCIDDHYFIECDYGDAQPCLFKDCRFDLAPVCANGHCFPMK